MFQAKFFLFFEKIEVLNEDERNKINKLLFIGFANI